MAKTLNQFLEGYLKVKNPDEQKFVDKHVVAKHADRNGNDDEVFKGSKVKMDDRRKTRHGYNPGEDEKVYEAVETERVKHPVGQRPKGPGWVLKQAGEQTGKDHSVWERKFKRVNEELKGNQHKIDANKNGKVDAHDFHLLRKKKKVAEEAEQIDELSKKTLATYAIKAKNQMGRDEARAGYQRGIRTMDGKGQGEMERAHDKRAEKRSKGIDTALNKLAKEEAGQIDELSINTMANYRRDRSRTAFSGDRKPGESTDDSIKRKSKQINSMALARTKIDRARNTGSTVLSKEEVEKIDELSPSTMGSYTKKAAADFKARKPKMGYDGQLKKMQNRKVGVDRALKKMYGEEVEELDEKLTAKTPMGTYIKDFQKSDAPQFKGKSQEKRRVMAIAAKLTAERGGKPLRKEEKLANLLGDLTESHRRTMLSVFDKLNESNQKKFLEACETPEGVEHMLDFSISHRGE